MKRTAKRPLPLGRMPRANARDFGVALSVASVLIMGLAVNWISAVILAISILYYAVVYTIWLKPRTPQNIVIGGGAGAFPPLIGWVAVTGHITLMPVLLFAIIFMWTPPHFWALALFVQSDYAKAGIPMMPVVAGEAATRRQILAYAVVLFARQPGAVVDRRGRRDLRRRRAGAVGAVRGAVPAGRRCAARAKATG